MIGEQNMKPLSQIDQPQKRVSRRTFLQTTMSAATGIAVAACTPVIQLPQTDPATSVDKEPANQLAQESVAVADSRSGESRLLEPTLSCDDGDHAPTIAQTLGPFYTPNTPERVSLLEEGVSSTRLMVSGYVLTTSCQPITGAILDFWHADDQGEYDNVGYRFRGHQFTDKNGFYQLETILPGLYTGRTRHIHVIVQGPETDQLTTQMYFPGESQNQGDSIYHPSLVMNMQDEADGSKRAFFDFVL